MSKTPKNTKGFEEAPQQPLSGSPLSGSVSDWAEEISEEARNSPSVAEQDEATSGDASLRTGESAEAILKKRQKSPSKKPKQPAAKSSKAGKSSRGTVIGGAVSPKERASTGLNPISGLEISLEAAEELLAKQNKRTAPSVAGQGEATSRSASPRTGGGADAPAKGKNKKKDDNTINKPFGYDGEALEGVTATVEALSELISKGNPLIKNGEEWIPHRPARPVKSDGGKPIKMVTEFTPSGDQPTAIKDLVEGITGRPYTIEGSGAENADAVSQEQTDLAQTQVLLGVTGSGKTFTMGKVIEATQRPALILAPNKTLAAQLYGEMKSFFPDNAVEYFVSYYDYYQPEAYVPRSDTYIEKESSVNEQIDRMRHSATRSLLERDDVIIVASVSCIYGIGSVK